MDVYEMRRNQALIDARARIHWGDPPTEAVKILMGQGIDYHEACAMVTEMVNERATALRAIGIRKLIFGVCLLAVPVLTWLGLTGIGYVDLKIMGLAVMAGVWGLYLTIRGILMAVSPSSETGDVADHNQ